MNMAVIFCNSGREIPEPQQAFWIILETVLFWRFGKCYDNQPTITEHQEDLTVNKGSQAESISRILEKTLSRCDNQKLGPQLSTTMQDYRSILDR